MPDKIVAELDALLSTEKPTLSDVVKDFSMYIGSREQEVAANITFILDTFQPSTNLRKLLRIKLINKYHVQNEVLKLLKSGDSLNINQALKCQWFFIDVADPVNFFNDLIPCLSLSTRLKVLNKYSSYLKNTKAAEYVYAGVKSRYGMRTAVSILPACGENFIRNELPNVKIALPPGIVLALFKKYPSLTTEYIKYLADDPRKRKDLSAYGTVLVKLASKDLDTFLELTEKHKDNLPLIKLGRRPTKKLLKTRNDKVLNNYSDYQWLLKNDVFFKRLSLDQMKKLYVSELLPPSFTQFLSGARTAHNTLRYVKPAVRSEVILTTFKTKYGREMIADDVLYNLQEIWVDYLPLENKIKWLESKIQENVTDIEAQANYVALLPVDQSMPRLKKFIESQSDASVRASIAKNMVRTLKINQCYSGIKDLLAYFVKRFRNETQRFRSGVVVEMVELGKLFLDMELEDWTPMMEFINIMKLNHEVYKNTCVDHKLIQILDFRVQNCFIKNGHVEGCLKDYLDFTMGDSSSVNYQLLELCENTPYRSFCLQWLLNVAPQLKWGHVSFQQGFHARLYAHWSNFNLKNPGSQIPCPGWLANSISNLVNDGSTHLHTLNIIRDSAKRSKEVEIWQSIVKRIAFMHFGCMSICDILQFEPNFILKNILRIMQITLKSSFASYSIFYRKSRLYDIFGIPSEIAKICRSTLKLENPEFNIDDGNSIGVFPVNTQPHAVRVLSIILPSSEYLKIAVNFAPKTSKVEEYSEETQALHDIQQAVGRSFLDVSSAVDVLPVLQKFAVGDYLKFVCGSLVSVCQRVPENSVLSVLKESMDCPVSLRKHYLKLLYSIAPTEERVAIFVNIFKTEKNVSLRLVLFHLLRKAFIDEPDDDTYQTYVSVFCQLTIEDESALKELFDIHQVDDDYVEKYLELIWELVSSKWASAVPRGRSNIVAMISCRMMKLLSNEFCDQLLSHELSDKLPNSCLSGFVSQYLIHAPSSELQAARLSKVMASLTPLIKSGWDKYIFSSKQVFIVRSIVSDLVRIVCSDAQNHLGCLTVHPIQLLESLKQTLSKLLKPLSFLRESLQLDLVIRQLQHQRSNLPSSALTLAVVDLYKTYLQTHNHCEYQLIKCMVECAPNGLREDLALALTSDSNAICQIVGIELIPSHISDEQALTVYKTVIENLSTSENPAVEAAAEGFFKSLSSSIM